jgi:membrane protein
MFRFAKRLKSPGPFLRHYLGSLYYRIDEDHVFLSAAGLAFSLLVCIIPFVLIVFAVLVYFLQALPPDSLEQEINAYIDRFIPYEQYASFVKGIIFSRLDRFLAELGGYKKIAVYVGVIGMLFAASGLFSSMRTILNRVYRVDAGKHVVIAKLRDFGMILLVLLFFLISTTSLPMLEVVKDSAHKIKFFEFFRLSFIQNVSFGVVSFLIVFVVFYTLYYLVPYAKLSKRVTAISALCATVLWELAKQAFGYYITNFASLKRIYGTYVLLVVVVFWIYYSSIIFIIGAEIGQLYRERRDTRLHSKA